MKLVRYAAVSLMTALVPLSLFGAAYDRATRPAPDCRNGVGSTKPPSCLREASERERGFIHALSLVVPGCGYCSLRAAKPTECGLMLTRCSPDIRGERHRR